MTRPAREVVATLFAAFDVAVRDGLITRYHMFEDTWAVAQAARDA